LFIQDFYGAIAMSMHRVLLRVAGPAPLAPQAMGLAAKGKRFKRQSDVVATTLNDQELKLMQAQPGVEVHPDVQMQPLWQRTFGPSAPNTPGLDEVLDRIKAPQAWSRSRGKDVYVAIIDTGICGTMPEFSAKKAGGWSWDGSDPWTDYQGHGSMCACIAAAGSAGKFQGGVAPDAELYACKTQFFTSELIDIYEWLMDRRDEHGKPIIASNSYGFYVCGAPAGIAPNHPYVDKLKQAIAAGITVVFAAGNNHASCGGNPLSCAPNTIWVWNSLDEVLSVGTMDQADKMWDYSSRGPGQWSPSKPDCIAPTYGEVMWQCGYKNMPNGWGTSGACPQVAGLAALIASANPASAPAAIAARIRSTCDAHNSGPTCSGAGVINCDRAI
jgi:subtilisin family serine protease